MWCALHAQPKKHMMLATRYGFHGKKGLAGDTTGTESKNPDVRFISFPMCDYCDKVPQDKKGQEQYCKHFYQDELDALWKQHPDDIALLITEPYLGAKGSFHPPKWYHQLLNVWCDAHQVSFILDEVQACYGRTGEMYAYQKYGIKPDLVVLGKGVGNGEPVAVTVGRAVLIDSLDYGEGSDTYSGNPHACAAVLAALDVYETTPVVENCRKMGALMEAGLRKLQEDFEFVAFVRGEGLVFGVDMRSYKGRPAAEIANQCVLEAYKLGLHIMGPLADKILRISPPLTITEAQVKEGLQLLRKAFEQVA
jgi:4-aminobutyrate aminotransferase-like enzyme